MSISLKLYMLSTLTNYEHNVDVLPAVVIFKSGKTYFAFTYDKYSCKTFPSKTGAYFAITQFKTNPTGVLNVRDKDVLISTKWLLGAFKRKSVKVYGIILLHAKTRLGVRNSGDFKLDRKINYGVDVELDNIKYENIKLHKKFKII